jgi:hypothetical protein
MPRKPLPTLSMSALLTFAGFAAISTACAEVAALPMQPAHSQMEKTVGAISNTALARRAHRSVDRGDFARRRAFGDGHMSSGFPGDLVGGTFAWPYFNYCRRHHADANCQRTLSTEISSMRTMLAPFPHVSRSSKTRTSIC